MVFKRFIALYWFYRFCHTVFYFTFAWLLFSVCINSIGNC